MSSVTFHTNSVIVRHNFGLSPFAVHPNNHDAVASLDDAHVQVRPINDYYIDRFVGHQGFAVDALAAIDVDFVLAGVANELVVALTFVEFVDLKITQTHHSIRQQEIESWSKNHLKLNLPAPGLTICCCTV